MKIPSDATWAEIGALDLVARGSLSVIVLTVLVIRIWQKHTLESSAQLDLCTKKV